MPSFAKLVFGAPFPEALRIAVHHAERVARFSAAALTAHECAGAATGRREAWLIGRAAEIEAFVIDLLADWRARAIPTHEAVRAIEAYLGGVHDGLRACVTGGARPPCCSLDDLLTRESPPFGELWDGGWDGAVTLVNASRAAKPPARTKRSAAAPGRSS